MSRFPHTDETRQKISESLAGRPKTREHREAIAASAPGWSDQARRQSKITRMIRAEKRKAQVEKVKKLAHSAMILEQREEVKKLSLITSPQMQMLWDRKYMTAGTMSPRELSVLWMATAQQHAFYRGKTKFGMTKRGMQSVVKLRSWLADVGIYPERYFRSIFNSASWARSRGRTWQPYISSAMSSHYFRTYIEWEQRLRSNDEGWIELMVETGVSRLPKQAQDSMLESAETLTDMVISINETFDILVDRYFLNLSPYLLFFMPAAQDPIARGRGTREQQTVFKALARDEKLRQKYKPFYDAALRYFKIAELSQERSKMSKEKIERTLRADFDARAKDVRLDLVDPASL